MEKNEDRMPIDPWINLASTSTIEFTSAGDIKQEIPTQAEEQVECDDIQDSNTDSAVEDNAAISYGPHTSFWGYSS